MELNCAIYIHHTTYNDEWISYLYCLEFVKNRPFKFYTDIRKLSTQAWLLFRSFWCWLGQSWKNSNQSWLVLKHKLWLTLWFSLPVFTISLRVLIVECHDTPHVTQMSRDMWLQQSMSWAQLSLHQILIIFWWWSRITEKQHFTFKSNQISCELDPSFLWNLQAQ